MDLYEYEMETGYWTGNPGPRYTVLETVEDRITGTVWHKLKTNEKATRLILKSKAYSQWDLVTENTGKKLFWVTDKLLTILHIQGLQKHS